MSMDKSWMQKDRTSREYRDGVVEFLNFAFARTRFDNMILCPCIKCGNRVLKNREEVHGDLLWNGIIERYIHWTSHGEDMYGGHISDESDDGDDMQGMLHDAFGVSNLDVDPFQQNEAELHQDSTNTVEVNDDDVTWNREDIEGVLIDVNMPANFLEGQNSSTQPSTPLPERTVDDQSQPSPPQVYLGGRGDEGPLEALVFSPCDLNPYFAPLQLEKWAEISEHSKEMMWRHIQAIAARNKANCSHRKMRHTGGTKSFACHRDEEVHILKAGLMGVYLPRVDMYFRTHLRKDGPPVDNFSGKIISKFRELAALSSQDGSSSFVGDDIYTQVMGPERHGRVRGYGLGPTPTSVFGSMSSQSRGQYEEMRARLDEQMEGLKTKHSKELQMQREVIQRQREEMQQEMQRMQEEMQKKQDEMMEVVRQIMSNQL
ncbi:hypothetical protein HHK36_020164 [Tetracentron sinense]|uniref:Transposase-associated domain-containing protein n=1 Tax=Tetracentron sinense TaxID=13715 RepID=A0A835DAP6_TETSI|nr:hypothetical protein HHK36_020164 [Tetracentron sinense]